MFEILEEALRCKEAEEGKKHMLVDFCTFLWSLLASTLTGATLCLLFSFT
jgi:hypothetical protein